MNERRGAWYLLTGLLLGAAIGLLISLVLLPVKYTDTEPSTLRKADRSAYRSLVARTYLVEADSQRALTRLSLLGDVYPADTLVEQAQSMLAEGGDSSEARAMALLASAINQPDLAITPLAGTQQAATATTMGLGTPTPGFGEATSTQILETPTPFATYTPRPTSTPKPTQGPPYRLMEQTEVCESAEANPLIQVIVQDVQGNPVPGVMIEVTMENSAPSYFYTGLYPEINTGYADVQIVPGIAYSLRVGEGGQLITGLSSPQCSGDGGETFDGGLKLVFQQP